MPINSKFVNMFCEGWGRMMGEAHRNAVEHGFWETGRNDGEQLALIHSELSECLEALRHGAPQSRKIPAYSAAEEELADVVIRVMDMAADKGWDIAGAVYEKIKYNQGRPYKHGKRF